MRRVRFTQTAKIKYPGLLCRYIQDAQRYLRPVFMSMILKFRGKREKEKVPVICKLQQEKIMSLKNVTYF